jgi:hypothetical protein
MLQVLVQLHVLALVAREAGLGLVEFLLYPRMLLLLLLIPAGACLGSEPPLPFFFPGSIECIEKLGK